MPSHYAHYRFGAAVLPTLPADVRRSIQRFRRLYDVGLHGPDLFYYYRPMSRSGSGALGIQYHEISGKQFFTRICRSARLERSEAVTAYLYGVLCHYVLDATLHIFLREVCAEQKVSHAALEAEFDRYLLELDGKFPPDGHRLTAHMDLTEGECETVARFYPPASAKTVQRALRSAVLATRALLVTDGPGRKAMEVSLGLLGRQAGHLLLPTTEDPQLAPLNAQLLERYDLAMAQLPEYLQQIQALMTYNAALGEDFDPAFG